MNEQRYKVTELLGSVKMVETYKIEGDEMLLGGYSIKYDREGNEEYRTENHWNLRVSGPMAKPPGAVWHE